jgi:hypothetical protein
MRDVFNGQIFIDTSEKHGKHLAIGVFTDGLKKYHKTKDQMWPFFVSLYNIPREKRLRKENIGKYYSKIIIYVFLILFFHFLGTIALFNGRSVDMSHFVNDFIMELHQLNSEGGLMTKKYGRLKVFCLTASLDSMARPKLQFHKQFNGFYGCTFCFCKGKTIYVESSGKKRKTSMVKYSFT